MDRCRKGTDRSHILPYPTALLYKAIAVDHNLLFLTRFDFAFLSYIHLQGKVDGPFFKNSRPQWAPPPFYAAEGGKTKTRSTLKKKGRRNIESCWCVLHTPTTKHQTPKNWIWYDASSRWFLFWFLVGFRLRRRAPLKLSHQHYEIKTNGYF